MALIDCSGVGLLLGGPTRRQTPYAVSIEAPESEAVVASQHAPTAR